MTARDFTILIVVCALWALNTVVSAIVVAPHHMTPLGVPPLLYAALRFGLVALVTLPWLWPRPRPTLRIIAVGLLMGAASFGLLFMGLRTSAPGAAAIVSQLGVPAATVLSILMLGEDVHWRRWLGILLALLGVVIVMWNPHSLQPSPGLLLVAASAVAGSLGAVLMKQTEGVKPLQFQAWVGAASAPAMIAASLLSEHGQVASVQAGGWALAAAVIFSALAVSVGAHTAYYGLIQRYEQTLIAPLTLMGPLMTVALGVAITGEQFGPRLAIGAGVALTGVLVIVLRRNHVAPVAILLTRLRGLMEIVAAPSPNFDARPAPPDMIVLHYTGMQTGEAALGRLLDPAAKVSAHYLVEEDGRVFALVPEARRAWHAGVSFWSGETNINAVSIGVEIVNPGHEFGYRPFPEAQIAAVIALLTDIRERWTVPDPRILGHSDVAPARKEDPGELFPWKRLAEAGHGLWVEPPPSPGPPLSLGDQGVGVFAFQAGLAKLGYDSAPDGVFDAATATKARAFQRHWRPERVDGVADGETRARLVALLRAEPRWTS